MLLLALLLLLQVTPSRPRPYFDFSTAGAGFYGTGRELPEPVDLKSVRIGILGPEKGPDGQHLRTAVEMAIAGANAKGGYLQTPLAPAGTAVAHTVDSEFIGRRIPFEIIFRPDDGPWGTAARHVVQFAYEDKVWAIIGGLDGISTHIAELIASKAWVPVISPGASDSSIDYANVPWVFRVMPSDRQQAATLLGYAKARRWRHIVVLTELQREAHAAYKCLRAESLNQKVSFDLHLEYPPENPMEITPRLRGERIDAIVLWGRSSSALPLIESLRKAKIVVPILAPHTLASLVLTKKADTLGEVIVASPIDLSRTDQRFLDFVQQFEARLGAPPSVIAFYAYDVAHMIIQAVQTAGLNRARIRDALSEGRFAGLTGEIRFTSLGGNPAGAGLFSLVRNGWKPLKD